MTDPPNAAEQAPTTTAVQFHPVKFTSSWREESLARICELRVLTGSLIAREGMDAYAIGLLQGAQTELAHAQQAAQQWPVFGALTGAKVHRVHAHLDTAEVLVLRGAPSEYVLGQLAALVVYIRLHLVPSDPRCKWADQLLEAERLSVINRERLVTAVQGAMAESRNEQMRLRSFRNLLLSSAAGLLVLAIGLGVVGAVAPEKLPMCFQPVQAAPADNAPAQPQNRRLVCPTGQAELPPQSDLDDTIATTVDQWDVPLIEFLGLIAAAVAAATALRKVRGTNTPYSLPAALAFLKLPLGAMTALLGLILMRGNFVPGLSALDSSAQIVAWAVIFGYAQQAFTQVVDRKAQNLLEDVGGAEQRERPTTPLPAAAGTNS